MPAAICCTELTTLLIHFAICWEIQLLVVDAKRFSQKIQHCRDLKYDANTPEKSKLSANSDEWVRSFTTWTKTASFGLWHESRWRVHVQVRCRRPVEDIFNPAFSQFLIEEKKKTDEKTLQKHSPRSPNTRGQRGTPLSGSTARSTCERHIFNDILHIYCIFTDVLHLYRTTIRRYVPSTPW